MRTGDAGHVSGAAELTERGRSTSESSEWPRRLFFST